MIIQQKKSLNELTGGDLQEAFEKLKKGDHIFHCDFSQLAKSFLVDYLPLNPLSIDFATLLKSYLQATKDPEELRAKVTLEQFDSTYVSKIPDDELEFYKYICKTYLYLDKEPKKELAALYDKAVDDLREIEARLSEIQQKLDAIHQRNQADEIQEKKPILYFYQQHNEEAHKEILTFMLHEIKTFAINKSFCRDFGQVFSFETPYRYSWNPAAYQARMPNDLDNKFGHYTMPQFNDLKKKYKDDKPLFYQMLHTYIRDEEIIFSIKQLLGVNHILFSRAEIITEALNIYEHGAKIMFASAIPTIIEGILHEFCLLIGEQENDLLQKGFQYKLDQLLPVMGYELYYEYYAFRFRIFRNKVAHGRLTKTDVDDLADFLLLDLFQICKLALSTKFPMNQKRFIINELHNNISAPDYKYLIEYIHLQQNELPEFYNLESQTVAVNALIGKNDFWDYLNNQLENGSDVVKHGIAQLATVIKKTKNYDLQCIAILRKTKISKPNKELATEYLKNIRRWY